MTETVSDDLAPCPICQAAMVVEHFAGWDGEYLPTKTVTHAKSSCPLAGVQFDATEEAVAAWNRRTPPQNTDGEPVAWMHPTALWAHQSHAEVAAHCMKGSSPIPLYSHPPAREAVDDATETTNDIAWQIANECWMSTTEKAKLASRIRAALQVKP